MKRLALVLSLVLVLAAGGVAALNLWPDRATAQDDEQMIPVKIMERIPWDEESSVAETCQINSDAPTKPPTPQQLVVSNQGNEIVALVTLVGTPVEDQEIGGFACTIESVIELPRASFYTLHLGDQRLLGFGADDLATLSDTGLTIDLGGDLIATND